MADDEVDPAAVVDSAAQAPASVKEGETEVVQHSLYQLREWEKSRRAASAARSGGLGLFYKRFVPPGT